MLPRRKLGHDAAPLAVNRHLRGDYVRPDRPRLVGVPGLFDNGRRCLVAGRFDAEYEHYEAATVVLEKAAARDSAYGGRNTPRSVMMPVMRRCGVTSNAGLRTKAPSGASRLPARWVTSCALRSSIGMCWPSGVSRSIVELGAAT